MMSDSYIQKMAQLLVGYSVNIKKGDLTYIAANAEAKELLLEIYREVVKAGGTPIMMPVFGEENYIFYKHATDEQLDTIPKIMEDLISTIDASIQLLSETNVKRLTNVDSKKIARRNKAQSKIMEIFMRRQATKELRWVLGPYPTQSLAQEASMSLEEYKEFVYHACLLHTDDPIAEWKKLSDKQEKICEYLNKKSELHIVGEDTDLKINISGRKWINCDGDNNMPDGEIFTGPVEDSAEGTIRFTYPAIYQGKEVEDVKLVFKKGKVVEASAIKGEGFLNDMLDTDNGSRYIGEAAIGTNFGITKFTKNMLFDEKMGGTIHIALGMAYPETGSNNSSSIHWDMLKDMKEGGRVYADGELFYENGKFIL